MRRLGRTLRQRQPSAQKTIAQKVASILRKYGTDAHVYLPGIGVINGLTAGNYLDSAGTTAATVDNPVGLVLDAAGSVGSELVTNGSFATSTGWTLQAGWTIGSGVLSTSASGSNANAIYVVASPFVIGNTYLVTMTVTRRDAGTVRVGIGGFTYVDFAGAAGTFSKYIQASASTSNLIFNNQGGLFSGDVDNISVKEVTGIHATQATTANKSILRLTSGKYNWVFDATDSLTATFPAGYESATIINTAETGQVTYTGQNIVGTYDMRGAVIGSELVVNGDFSSATGWGLTGGWGIASGVATNSGTIGNISQDNLTVGKTYIITFDIIAVSNWVIAAIGGAGNQSFNTIGRKTMVATAGSAQLLIGTQVAGHTATIDNVSVKEITAKEYGRIIFKTAQSASDLAVMQRYANRLAGLS
ncbi:MAG TPA: hypothetical protein VIO56_06715 [Methylotenera sp.]